MKAYILYKDKSVKRFKHIINTGSGIFDKYRTLAVNFIRYASSDLDLKLGEYIKDGVDIESIHLESIFPTKYKWLVSDVSLRNSSKYLQNLESRITEFEGGKENNLKILVGVNFLKLVLITKIVETYLQAYSAAVLDPTVNVPNSLAEIGIKNQVLKNFDSLKDIGDKSIDDWLNVRVDPIAATHFYSSMKRILQILISKWDN